MQVPRLWNLLTACGWAGLATFACVMVTSCLALTAGVLTTSWVNALKGHKDTPMVGPFKLLLASGLTFVAVAGAVRLTCVTYCHLLIASTTLPQTTATVVADIQEAADMSV